jgi:hypothetical protein
MLTSLLILNFTALVLGICITLKVRVLSNHPQFPTLTQSAGFMALRWQFWIYLFKWDVVVYDLDFLKQINTMTGDQERSDEILSPGMAYRNTPWWTWWRRLPDVAVYTQFDNGDKFVLLVRKGCGLGVAERIRHNIEHADMRPEERAALMASIGRDHVSATFVVIPSTNHIPEATRRADRILFDTKDVGLRNIVIDASAKHSTFAQN